MTSERTNQTSARHRRLGLTLLLALFCGHLALYPVLFDDAFITFRYARHLADGLGLTYNPGEIVDGCTSPGWAVLLAVLARLGIQMPTSAQVLSIVASLGLVAFTVRIARVWRPELGSWWSLGAGLLVAAHGTVACYGRSGMESTLFGLLITSAGYFLSGHGRRNAFAAGIVLALSAAIRPSAPLYWFALVLAIGSNGRRGRRDAVTTSLAFAALFTPYFAWHWVHFGYPFPNTFYAKARIGASEGLLQVAEFVFLHLFWLAPIGLVLLRSKRAERWWGISAALLGGAATELAVVGGDGFGFFRFVLPAIPVGSIGIVVALRELVMRLAARRGWSARRTGLTAAATLAVVASVTFGASWVPLPARGPNRRMVLNISRIDADYFLVGRWLRRSFPRDTTLAIDTAGIVPFESQLRTIDMLGLNDVHIAHRKGSDSGTIGHQKHDAAYVLGRRPSILVLGLPELTPRAQSGTARVPALPGDRELFARPELAQRYRLEVVELEPGRWFTFYLRNDVRAPPGLDER